MTNQASSTACSRIWRVRAMWSTRRRTALRPSELHGLTVPTLSSWTGCFLAWMALRSCGDKGVVDEHIGRLRKLVEDDPSNPRLLITVLGAGVGFEDEAPLDSSPRHHHLVTSHLGRMVYVLRHCGVPQ